MDEGVRNSVVTSIGFIGFVFSLILGIAVMGGSFGSIAIIAGALSFGAGLGLQNIVSNLVAGLTILFERPIKLGDWVIINGQEGIVKQISMRSTTLESGNKASIIIQPDILSSPINMTCANRMGRAEITVGVDYDSDIALVRQTLLDIATENPMCCKIRRRRFLQQPGRQQP
ncbi:MAG: mechanosensitive ion channel family protein [Alphaproteobacteria bacterium]